MKHKYFSRLLSVLLAVITLISVLSVSAGAVSIVNSNTANIQVTGRSEILKKTGNTTMGANSWSYKTNDGITGTA